jgi:hypothetical protein
LTTFYFFFANSWASLFPTPSTAKEINAKLEAMLIRSGKPVVASAEPTSQGLRRMASPLLILMLCCAVVALFSASSLRKKHRQRHNSDGYDSGWVVQRGAYAGRDDGERKDR